MSRKPLRPLLLFTLLAIVLAIMAAPSARLISHLMAAESAELSAFLPAIFGPSENPQPTPSPTQGTPAGTATATRPPKETAMPTVTVFGTAAPTATKTPTPIFTNTPISFATKTPGFTPQTPTTTPSPTPQTSQAIVLPNFSSYVDKGHFLHVVGEVKNNGATTIQFVNIKAVFYSPGGTELDDARTYAALTILPPGEKTCFEFVLPEPQGYSYYTFVDVAHLDDADPPLPLTISNVQSNLSPTYGFYNLAGKITSNGDTPLLDIKAIGTLYDSNGIVRGCQKKIAGLDGEHHDLQPNQSVPFELNFTGRDNADVASYRVQADGAYPDEE